MPKDDFEAVAYKVLSYLYACLKTDAVPSKAKALEMSRDLAGVGKRRTARGRAAKRPQPSGIKPHPARGRLFSRPGTGGAPRACGDDPSRDSLQGCHSWCSPRVRG